MPFEREALPIKENALEKNPNKNEEIVAETPEIEEPLSPVEFNQELQSFHENKEDLLGELNEVRSEIGIPEKTDDMPVELVQAEKHLKTLYDKLGKGDYVDFEKLKNDEDATDVALVNKVEKPADIEPINKAEKPVEQEQLSQKSEITTVEKTGERKLEPGDEVYSDGNFYKIYNIQFAQVNLEYADSCWY